jgi:hypothetical protein
VGLAVVLGHDMVVETEAASVVVEIERIQFEERVWKAKVEGETKINSEPEKQRN